MTLHCAYLLLIVLTKLQVPSTCVTLTPGLCFWLSLLTVVIESFFNMVLHDKALINQCLQAC